MTPPNAGQYTPRFRYTDEIVCGLMTIEGACRLVDLLPLPPDAAFVHKHEAQSRATRFSTAIEGNAVRLQTLREGIVAADRDGSQQLQEVRNYWMALEWLEAQLDDGARLTEEFIRRLHRIIIVRRRGRRGEMSDYRTDECPVVDVATRQVDYAPPAPQDAPDLVSALVAWRGSLAAQCLPGPVRAAILAYQFVTIHPFNNGNGRTARALATAELWFSGYRMRGFLSMEESYYSDLQRYYDSLQMGLDVDYYRGRHDPDLTPWVAYFVQTMAEAASAVRDWAATLYQATDRPPVPWEQLNRRQQQVLSRLVIEDPGRDAVPDFVPSDVARWFAVSAQTARAWLTEWHASGFVVPAGGQQRVRSWRLTAPFAELVATARKAAATGE